MTKEWTKHEMLIKKVLTSSTRWRDYEATACCMHRVQGLRSDQEKKMMMGFKENWRRREGETVNCAWEGEDTHTHTHTHTHSLTHTHTYIQTCSILLRDRFADSWDLLSHFPAHMNSSYKHQTRRDLISQRTREDRERDRRTHTHTRQDSLDGIKLSTRWRVSDELQA